MNNFFFENARDSLPNDEHLFEWLVNQLYPNGIECPACEKVTKHHKVKRRSCIACDVCGHQIYPTKGTLFYKSHLPLKTWLEVMQELAISDHSISAKEIQSKYKINYKTSKRMLQMINDVPFKDHTKLFGWKNEKNGILDLHSDSNGEAGQKTKNRVAGRSSNIRENAGKYYWKRDRTARLLKLEMLLAQYPAGLEIGEIASKCSVSARTVYRDLVAIEQELGVPIWEKDGKRGIVEGFTLPTITFSTEEAMRVFLALRLMLNYSHEYDSYLESTFIKLNKLVPYPLNRLIQNCLRYMEKLPTNELIAKNLEILTDSWLSRHRVKFTFQELTDKCPIERIFDTYFIEPGMYSHSTYLIGYCHYLKSVTVYKTDRIIGKVYSQNETYEIPSNFDAIDYLKSVWTMPWSRSLDGLYDVKLRFNPRLQEVVKNTIWHPSQKIQTEKDGSTIMTLRVQNTLDFRAWILGWDSDIEVLEPVFLRERIIQICKELQSIYLPEKTKSLTESISAPA